MSAVSGARNGRRPRPRIERLGDPGDRRVDVDAVDMTDGEAPVIEQHRREHAIPAAEDPDGMGKVPVRDWLKRASRAQILQATCL